MEFEPRISESRLVSRVADLGITRAALAARSGVSIATVNRVLGGRLGEAAFAHVAAIAAAVGLSLDMTGEDAAEFCRRQARRRAEEMARLVQGTSALEAQAVDAAAYERLVEQTYHELLAGSRRRLWAR